jgi:hypothetical protein
VLSDQVLGALNSLQQVRVGDRIDVLDSAVDLLWTTTVEIAKDSYPQDQDNDMAPFAIIPVVMLRPGVALDVRTFMLQADYDIVIYADVNSISGWDTSVPGRVSLSYPNNQGGTVRFGVTVVS